MAAFNPQDLDEVIAQCCLLALMTVQSGYGSCHLVIPCKFLRATQGLFSATRRQTHRVRVCRQQLHLLGPTLAHPALQANQKRRPVRPRRHHRARRQPRMIVVVCGSEGGVGVVNLSKGVPLSTETFAVDHDALTH